MANYNLLALKTRLLNFYIDSTGFKMHRQRKEKGGDHGV